jgi:hypothetical protein
MAINVYDRCTNPITGEILKGISVTSYVFTMQWIKKAGSDHSAVPHIHINQDEIFYVNKGQLKLRIGNKERTAGPGEKIIVGRGKSHIVVNTPEELDITLECRPALDYEKLLQCYEGLIQDGYTDEKGAVDMRMMAYFMKKMKCRSITIPADMPLKKFKWMLHRYYLLGMTKGWISLYKKYTQ